MVEPSSSALDKASADASAMASANRVIKCGWQHVRTKHKSWRRQWIVLRGHTLTYYKDEREYKPQEVISLSYASTSTVAVVECNDGRHHHHHHHDNSNHSHISSDETNHHQKVRWAIFTPSQNRYFRAGDLKTALDWVDAVKSVINTKASEADTTTILPLDNGITPNQPPPSTIINEEDILVEDDEFEDDEYDLEPPRIPLNSAMSNLALSSTASFEDDDGLSGREEPIVAPNITTQHHDDNDDTIGGEPIIFKGPLISHRKRYGRRLWKRVFAILTDQRLLFYKFHPPNQHHGQGEKLELPIKIILLSDIIDVLEIDALSKSKLYCMQIITNAKVRRFAAPSEEALTQWLVSAKGALKGRQVKVKVEGVC